MSTDGTLGRFEALISMGVGWLGLSTIRGTGSAGSRAVIVVPKLLKFSNASNSPVTPKVSWGATVPPSNKESCAKDEGEHEWLSL